MNKLNFLLVMPRFVTTIGEFYGFPLGIPYISAVMKQSGFNVFTLNLNHVEGDVGAIVNKEIENNKIDVLMTGGLSGHFNKINSFVKSVREKNAKLKIVVGGGIITADPEVAIKAFGNVDVGVIGEGEITTIELCNAFQTNGDLSKISGIIYENNGIWIQTKLREEIKDLDSLPFPDYEGFEIKKYLEIKPPVVCGMGKEKEISVIASRSCPYQCTFCFHTTGRKYRKRSIENLLEEIKFLKDKYGIKSVLPRDELFSIDSAYLKKFSDALKELGITWDVQFRVVDVNEENMDILRNSTCYAVRIGIESADNSVLKSMRKMITIEQTEKAISLINKTGLPVSGNIILGDVTETFETAKRSIEWWKKHKEYNFGLYFIETYPGTPIYEYAIKNGIIKNPVKFLQEGCPVVNLTKMSKEKLSEIIKQVMLLPIKESVKLEKQKILRLGANAIADLSGVCPICKHKGLYENKLLFHVYTLHSFTCDNCGNKFMPDITQEIKGVIIKNFLKLLINNKVAIWGVLPYVIEIFDDNEELSDKNILFIDNSSFKQMAIINGNKVHTPEILANGDVDTVVYCYGSARMQIEKSYPQIKKIIKFDDLLLQGDKI